MQSHHSKNPKASLLFLLTSARMPRTMIESEKDLATHARYWYPAWKELASHGISLIVAYGEDVAEDIDLPFEVYSARARFIVTKETSTGPAGFTIPSIRLFRILATTEVSAILALEYSINTFFVWLCCRIRRKQFWIFQEAHRRDSKWKVRFRRFLSSRADLIIANSHSAEQDLQENLGVPTERILRAPLLSPPPRELMLKQPFALPRTASDIVFLTVAQLIPRKNLFFLLQACQLVRQVTSDFRVWIVGDGPDREALIAMRDDYLLQDIVQFFGSVPYHSMGYLYEAADVFVLPSRYDYRSVSVLEAMRFGLPILDSSGDGNTGETVLHGESGFVFDPNNAEQLAAFMIEMVANPDRRKAMADRSLTLIEHETAAVAADIVSARLRETHE